ncbi:PKD domain-containing protein, partial [Kaarinaea lacus]
MKLQILTPRFFIAVFLLLLYSQVFAFSGGAPGYSGRPPASNCTDCHSGGQVPQVTLEGPESVTAGTQSTLFLRISGGQQSFVGYGISLPVDGGYDEKTHGSPINAGTAEAVIEITWNVPNTSGTYTIYAFGLSTNGNGDTSGDNGAAATHTLEVTEAAGIQRPALVLSVPPSSAPGASVTLDGSGTVHPDSQKTFSRFLWDFGDGSAPQSTDSNASITHTYNNVGTYTVT